MKKALLISEPCRLEQSIESELGARGIDCTLVEKKSLRDRKTCEEISAGLEADIVIYSALTPPGEFPEHIADMNLEDWRHLKDEAFRLPYDVYGTFVEKMTLNCKGRFMLICPLTGVLPAAEGEATGAIGSAGITMMKNAVLELGDRGFTGCAVAIGSLCDDEIISPIKSTENVRRHEPADIRIDSAQAARQIVSLLMDIHPAMTGGIFRIDSGLSCGYMREW